MRNLSSQGVVCPHFSPGKKCIGRNCVRKKFVSRASDNNKEIADADEV